MATAEETVAAVLDGIVSPMLASGMFARVNRCEPKSAPGSGLTAAVWLDNVGPAVNASGLAATSARLVFKIRLYTSMISEPQDAIDPAMLAANIKLMGLFSEDFDLGMSVRNVDLLGAHGISMSSQAGYLNQDGKLMRITDITLPLVMNDLWEQSA
jgi:hypothetical protein